jgi:hypothetical protein
LRITKTCSMALNSASASVAKSGTRRIKSVLTGIGVLSLGFSRIAVCRCCGRLDPVFTQAKTYHLGTLRRIQKVIRCIAPQEHSKCREAYAQENRQTAKQRRQEKRPYHASEDSDRNTPDCRGASIILIVNPLDRINEFYLSKDFFGSARIEIAGEYCHYWADPACVKALCAGLDAFGEAIEILPRYLPGGKIQ